MLTECPDELPNPHKNCIREMLNALILNDHDVKRLNIELRNIQQEYDAELVKTTKKCGDEHKKPICEGIDELTAFARKITCIDELKQHYAKMAEDKRKQRDNIIVYARQCLHAYNEEKCKFKNFHENTIDYIKRTATLAQDPEVVRRCERDICELHKRFVKEVANMKRSEQELLPFFKLLKDSDPNVYCECCCFKEYDWMPPGKQLGVVDDMAKEIKNEMGQVLVRAFAQLHLHMPQDSRSFIAAYLMNLDRNEQEMKEKMDIFKQPKESDSTELADPNFKCDVECEHPYKEEYEMRLL